ncbi:desmocollin-3 [Callorhinchus milii]|uniref:Desmocollin-3-like n=1 Tax=Callorhinchus milii TaxID=7868 RepID=A0A4W3GB90_CALMI|nr:desmocollin-3 [Callorhinchus milii]|eukprot:gi/632954923/ref/XP_007893219.1/ PREDICTED: desmocollin-3-like [Callorhinchus milii]
MALLQLLRGAVLLSTLLLVLTNFGKASSDHVAKYQNYEESVDSGSDFPIRSRREATLRRQKRRWSPLPFTVTENDIGPYPKFLQTIRSDKELGYTLKYFLSGEGVDLNPTGLFIIDPDTGGISITRAVDRETYPIFKMIGNARTLEGFTPEMPLDITVKVIDENDNKPEFTQKELQAYVPELSAPGTWVANLTATDKDEANTQATLLRYKILGPGAVSNLFAVDASTGVLTTKRNILRRSDKDTYTIKVEVRDSGGKHYGLASTGHVIVHVTDVNNHLPTFAVSKYTVDVLENVNNVELLKIPVEDQDEPNTNASRAVFTITKGNENNHFKIVTDPKTNEGILSVVKPLDAEEAKVRVLEVEVANEAPLVGDPVKLNSAEVTVNVGNVDEGPEFVPAVEYLSAKEDVAIGSSIGSYTAKDPDTQSSAGIRYQILSDPAKWVAIDGNTGKLSTIALMDRESSFVTNNKYNVTVLAIDNATPSKTGTGTVVINLNDVNDHIPVIEEGDWHICQNGNQKYVKISAVDLDVSPNSAPFRFLLPDIDIKEKWTFTKTDATYAYLAPKINLPNGYYEVPVVIQDQQNQGTQNTVKVVICDCPDGLNCAGRSGSRSTRLGGWGILALLLGALLLLCLLLAALACFFKNKDQIITNGNSDTKYHQSLIVTNEEGGGQQDKDMGTLSRPIFMQGQMPSREYDFQSTQKSAIYAQNDAIKGGAIPFNNGEMMNLFQNGYGYEEGMNEQYTGTMLSQESMANMNCSGTLRSQNGIGNSHSIREYDTSNRRSSAALIELLRTRIDQVYEEEEQEENYLKEHEFETAGSLTGFSDGK